MLEETEMISERQAAKLMGIHPSTLMNWRKNGLISLKYEEKIYLKGNSRIFYQQIELIEWAKQKNLLY
jgi:DNA-binding transcriptional MerR regulator